MNNMKEEKDRQNSYISLMGLLCVSTNTNLRIHAKLCTATQCVIEGQEGKRNRMCGHGKYLRPHHVLLIVKHLIHS